MGVAVGEDRIAVGAKGQVWFLHDHSELAPQLEPAGRYDRCFLARSSTVTGGIQGHEMAWGTDADGEPDLWVVNTLFSCLVGLDPAYSFVPRWRPPFIRRWPARTAATSTAWPCATAARVRHRDGPVRHRRAGGARTS